MPRICVRHPSGKYLMYSTIVDDFIGGPIEPEAVASVFRNVDAQMTPVYEPSFLDSAIRDDPERWEETWDTFVEIHGLEHAINRMAEFFQEPA